MTGKYCSQCGQERVKRLEVKSIVRDVLHGILHWENSVLKTLLSLLKNPGKTTKDYVTGKRKSFVKPFSYFISIQTIFVIVFHRMSENYFAFLNVKSTGTSENSPIVVSEIQHLVSQYINYFNYFMPVIFAFYFYLFFRKKTGVNYAESLAISLYWVGTTLIFSIALMMLSFLEIRIWNVRFVVSLGFYIFAIIKFTDISIFKGILKGLSITALSYTTFVLFVTALIMFYLYVSKGISIF
jgi:hypothetical protein